LVKSKAACLYLLDKSAKMPNPTRGRPRPAAFCKKAQALPESAALSARQVNGGSLQVVLGIYEINFSPFNFTAQEL
jgi:hypothetical protein